MGRYAASGDSGNGGARSDACGRAGEAAALYRDIKAVTGVGTVNLFWRRLASEPALLAWAWGTVRPLFAAGEVAHAVTALDEALDLGTPAPWAPEALAAVGVGEAALAEVRRIVAAYNRGNAGNLFALTALLAFLDRNEAPSPRTEPPGPTPAQPEDLPPITAMAAMPATTAAHVRTLSAPLSPPGQALIPSLYRHLAPWPGVLALAAVTVLPLEESGRTRRLADSAIAGAQAAAADFAALLRPPAATPLPSADTRARLAALAAAYTRGPIAIMTVLGRLLARALPAPAQTGPPV